MTGATILHFPPMAKNDNHLPNQIRRHRKAAGLTQDELGERIGTTGGAVSQMETGLRDLTLNRMRAIARALDITVADLLNPEDNPYATSAEKKRLSGAWDNSSPDHQKAILSVAESFSGFHHPPPLEGDGKRNTG